MFICNVSDCVFVTAKAGIGRGAAWMTGRAGNNWIVTVSKREGVLEGGWLPGSSGVTSRAIRASLVNVRILGFMTGITIFGRAHEDTVGVTTCTGNTDMCSSQREGG